jgi:hypothetical protein
VQGQLYLLVSPFEMLKFLFFKCRKELFSVQRGLGCRSSLMNLQVMIMYKFVVVAAVAVVVKYVFEFSFYNT